MCKLRHGYRYEIIDAEHEQYCYAEPVEYADGCTLGDCWIVDKDGEVHPGYNVSPVPFWVESLTNPTLLREQKEDLTMHEGYENYETWNVALWLNNEYGDYVFWTERAKELRIEAPDMRQVKSGIWTAERAVVFTLADEIEASVKDANPLTGGASMFVDLLDAALGNVDWQEVAQSFVED